MVAVAGAAIACRYAAVTSFEAVFAGPPTGPPTFWVPPTMPGGKPVTEVPGYRSRFPLNVVAPVLVTVVAATTEAAAAEARFGAVTADHAGDELKATASAPPANATAPRWSNFLGLLDMWCFIQLLL
jgi:hypothetical protein